jgi:hypothetical protein
MLPSVGIALTVGALVGILGRLVSSASAPGRTVLGIGVACYIVASAAALVRSTTRADYIRSGAAGAQKTLMALREACPQIDDGAVVTLMDFPAKVWWPGRAQAAFRYLFKNDSIEVRGVHGAAAAISRGPALQWSAPAVVKVVAACATPSTSEE